MTLGPRDAKEAIRHNDGRWNLEHKKHQLAHKNTDATKNEATDSLRAPLPTSAKNDIVLMPERECLTAIDGHIEHTSGYRDWTRFRATRNLHHRWRLLMNGKMRQREKHHRQLARDGSWRAASNRENDGSVTSRLTVKKSITLAVTPHDRNYHHCGGHTATEMDGYNIPAC